MKITKDLSIGLNSHMHSLIVDIIKGTYQPKLDTIINIRIEDYYLYNIFGNQNPNNIDNMVRIVCVFRPSIYIFT